MDHLRKKSVCDPVYSDIDVSTVISHLEEEYNTSKPHACRDCGKRFSYKSGLYRHLGTHKQATPTTHATVKVTGNNNVTNTTVNNVTNNYNLSQNVTINVLPMGQEDISHVLEDTEFLTKCLKNVLLDGIPNLVEKIYMDPETPKNHNVLLKRIKKPGTMLVLVKTPGNDTPEWVEKPLNTTLDEMIEKGSGILIKHNNHIYRISHDEELWDDRSTKLSNVRSKKRGVYGNIRDGVLCKVKNNRNQPHPIT
jgi:hypothetical protein